MDSSAVWMKLFFISAATSIVSLAIGVLGGFFLLIALNGFRESDARPIIYSYVAIVLAGTAIFGSTLCWWAARKWFTPANVSFWGALGLNIAVIVGILIMSGAVIMLWLLRRQH